MPWKIKNRINIRYGRLIVIKLHSQDYNGNAYWLCKCNCGNEIIVRGRDLQSGNTKSCGCLFQEVRNKQIGKNAPRYIHGQGRAKREARKQDNYTCQNCGKTQEQELETDNRKLSVHHIDGNDTNNNLENLITLCNSCHKKIK